MLHVSGRTLSIQSTSAINIHKEDSEMSKPQVTANFLPAVQHPVENDEAAWSRHVNEEGFIYYYNEVTGESSWLEPCFICGEPYRRTLTRIIW